MFHDDLEGWEGGSREMGYMYVYGRNWGFPGGSVVKNLPANAGDMGSIPGSGRPPEKEMAAHSSILAWETSWTEETGRLQSMRSQRVRHDKATKQQQQHCRS